MKDYPLEIQNVGEDDYMLMSKGHHELKGFMSEVRRQGYDWPLGMPEHLWAKTVPNSVDGVGSIFVIVDKDTRGAWPCTLTCEAYGEEQYEEIIKSTQQS